MKSWIEIEADSDFSMENIPFGIGLIQGNGKCICTRIGDTVIDLAGMARLGYFDHLGFKVSDFEKPVLNDFISKGKKSASRIRTIIQECFMESNSSDSDMALIKQMALHNASEIQMLMPVLVGDYTDFYSSIEHATNVGMMFRDPANALLPNWRHIPVGYHGRASSIVVSGAEIHRPKGQIKPATSEFPVFSPTMQLDFELETAFVIGKENPLGDSISTAEAEEYIFGMVLFNDLSARDIQSWEYVPLGPFLSKNFASVISPWIVTLDALEPFRCNGPGQQPEVLPYLQFDGERNFDINLQVRIKPENKEETIVSKSNFKYMYWNMSQQLAHHTINGCNMRVGDLCGSGTISGPDAESYGSMLELTWKGTKPIAMPDGSERKFINDNDTVIMRGFGKKDGIRVGFGEANVKILPVK
ncbi:MAG: fumarylacetoacetase [Bacteroidales bacterium]|nr:fumarylacetoacetase [Bacteroidales bacterium]